MAAAKEVALSYGTCSSNELSARQNDNYARAMTFVVSLVRGHSSSGASSFVLALVAGFAVNPDVCHGNEALLDEIRSQAYFHVSAIRTIQFSFESSDSKGWRCKSEFYGDGNRFRVNRQDSTGMMLGNQRTPPASFAAAFNGDRYQFRHDSEKILRLENGNANAQYTIDIPQITLYGWLSTPGKKKLRWDTILDSDVWNQRFETGIYTGRVAEGDRAFETVDFPQRKGVKTPCLFKVYFAEDLQYFPLKWVRRVEETDEVASTVEVSRFTQVDLDGASIVLPLELQVTITGADKMALARTETWSISDETLMVNNDIDASVFNIDLPPGYELYDMDRLSSAPSGETLTEKPTSPFRTLVWINVGFIVLVVSYVIFLKFRRRSV